MSPLLRPGHGVAVGDLGDEPEPQRRGRVEVIAAEQRLLRTRQPDELHQPGDAAVGWHEADAALTKQQASPRGRDPPVARERERQAGTRGDAVDRSHSGLLEPLDRLHELREPVRDVPIHARVMELLEASEVAAGAERAAGAGQHQRAYVGRAGRPVKRAGQRVAKLSVERVAAPRPVERQREHAVTQRCQQRHLIVA